MELIDFKEHKKFNELRERMGANYIHYYSSKWTRFNPRVFLEELNKNGSIDLSYDQLTIDQDSTFNIYGQRVLVYIKRQKFNTYSEYKYHLSDKCITIKGAKKASLYDKKYVASIDTDGFFKVDLVKGYRTEKDKLVRLNVCRHCLRALNFDDYLNKSDERKDKIYKNFSLESFLAKGYEAEISKPTIYGIEKQPAPSLSHQMKPIKESSSAYEKMKIVRQAKNYIAKGDVSEALSLLKVNLTGSEFEADVIFYSNQYGRNTRASRESLVTREEYNVEINKLVKNLLSLISEYEEQ